MTVAMRTGVTPANSNENGRSPLRQSGQHQPAQWPSKVPEDAEGGIDAPSMANDKSAVDQPFAVTDASDAARDENDGSNQPLTDREFVQLLQNLDAAIENAQHVFYAGMHTLESRAQEAGMHTLESKAQEADIHTSESEAKIDVERIAPPPHADHQPARHRKSRIVLMSAAGGLALLGGLGGLGWLGWQMLQGDVIVSAGGVGQEAPALAGAAPAEADGATFTGQRPAEAQAALTSTVHGRAGEPIPLGIRLPQHDEATEVSVMIRGVPEDASLSAGRHLGGDSWVLNADQVGGAALHLPEDFAPSRVTLGFYVVASNGRIPEAHTIAVNVEPASSPPAQTGRIVADNDVAAPARAMAPPQTSEPTPEAEASAQLVGQAPASRQALADLASTSGREADLSPPPAAPSGVASEQAIAPPQTSEPAPEAQAPSQPEGEASVVQQAPADLAAAPSQEPEQPEAPQGEAGATANASSTITVRTVEVLPENAPQGSAAASPDGAAAAFVSDAGSGSSSVAAPSEDAATASLEEGAPAEATAGEEAAKLAAVAPTSEPQPPLPSQAADVASTRNDDAPAAAEPSASDDLPAPTRKAKVTTHVNMRAGPDNDAAVITVVGTGREVGIVECRSWCEVVYAGHHGWIHSRFIASTRAPAANTATAAPARASAARSAANTAPAAPARAVSQPAREPTRSFGSRIKSFFGFQE